MHDHRTQLASLIASRICHDLISPVGAISNGLELVSLGGGMSDGPELTLINESCENANARIRFFRLAYGAASEDATVGLSEITSIFDAVTRGSRLEVAWHAPGDIPRADAQLAFLGFQCAETALRRGGRIDISAAPGRIEIECSAEHLAADPELWSHLRGPGAAGSVAGEATGIAPAQVQFALLPLLAADRGRKPHAEIGEGRLTLTV